MKSILMMVAAFSMSASALEWSTYDLSTKAVSGRCSSEINSILFIPKELESSKPDQSKVKAQQVITDKMNSALADQIGAPESFGKGFNTSDFKEECVPGYNGNTVGLYSKVDVSTKFAESWTSLSIASDSYMGGAHGFVGIQYLVLAASGDVVKFSSVLGAPHKQFVEAVIVKLKAQSKYDEEWFANWAKNFSQNAVELNYMANEHGVTVMFNQYEIASYAVGPIEITFEWSELKTLLRKDSVFSEYLK